MISSSVKTTPSCKEAFIAYSILVPPSLILVIYFDMSTFVPSISSKRETTCLILLLCSIVLDLISLGRVEAKSSTFKSSIFSVTSVLTIGSKSISIFISLLTGAKLIDVFRSSTKTISFCVSIFSFPI